MNRRILLVLVASLFSINSFYSMYKPLSRHVVRHTAHAVVQNVARRTVLLRINQEIVDAAEKEKRLRYLPHETELHTLTSFRKKSEQYPEHIEQYNDFGRVVAEVMWKKHSKENNSHSIERVEHYFVYTNRDVQQLIEDSFYQRATDISWSIVEYPKEGN